MEPNVIRLSRCTPMAHQVHSRWGQTDQLLNLICVQMAGWLVGTESSQDRLGGNYPIKFERLAPPSTGQNLTLSDIMLQRATELWSVGKPINVLWSGGIDSTAALVALMITNSDWINGLRIITTQHAITEEYPRFYNELLLNANVTIVEGGQLLTRDSYLPNQLYVTGDIADQLFGFGFSQQYVGTFDKTTARVPLVNIRRELFNRTKTIGESRKAAATRWPSLNRNQTTPMLIHELLQPKQLTHLVTEEVFLAWLDLHLARAPFNIVTVLDMLWWLNFTLKWSEKKYRLVGVLGDSTMEDSTAVFFDTPEFEWWSMNHHSEKLIGDDWKTYKQPLKDFIFSFNGDEEYRLNKMKEVSLMHTLEPINGVGQNIVTYWDSNNLLLTKNNSIIPPAALRSVYTL